MAACPGLGKMPRLTCTNNKTLAAWQTLCNVCARWKKYNDSLKKHLKKVTS